MNPVDEALAILDNQPPILLSGGEYRKLLAGLLGQIPGGFGLHDDRCAIRQAHPCNCPIAGLRKR